MLAEEIKQVEEIARRIAKEEIAKAIAALPKKQDYAPDPVAASVTGTFTKTKK